MKRSIIALFISAFVFSACSLAGSGVAENVITIGVPIPLTGIAAIYGVSQMEALEIAKEEINASGGVGGRKVRIIYEDTQLISTRAVTAVNKLIAVDRAVALIGPAGSSEIKAINSIVNREKIPTISPTAYADNISGKGDYVFRITPIGRTEGETMAEFAYSHGLRRISILVDKHEDTLAISNAFAGKMKMLGGKIISTHEVLEDLDDLHTPLSLIKREDSDAIYLPLFPGHTGHALKQIKELGISKEILGSIFLEEGHAEIESIAGVEAMDEIAYPYPDYVEREETDKKMMTKYGHVAGPSATEAYDALHLLVKIMREHGTSPEQIKNGLYNIKDYYGASGLVSFNEYGDAIKPFIIKVVRGGKFVTWDK